MKTELLIDLGRHYEHKVDIVSMQQDNDVVARASTARILGVIIDSHLNNRSTMCEEKASIIFNGLRKFAYT